MAGSCNVDVCDGLDEGGFGIFDEFGEGSSEDLASVGLLLEPGFGADFSRGDSDAVGVVRGIGHEGCVCARGRGGVAIPDPIQETLSGLDTSVFAGDCIPGVGSV